MINKECWKCGHPAHDLPCRHNRTTWPGGIRVDGPCDCRVKDSDDDLMQQILAVCEGNYMEDVLNKCEQTQKKLRATRDDYAIYAATENTKLILEVLGVTYLQPLQRPN